MASKGGWTLTIYVNGRKSHVSSHNARRYAEREFRRLTGFAWKEAKRRGQKVAHLIGSEIRNAERGIRDRI